MTNSQRDNSDNRSIREKLLAKAASLITGQRQEDYGSPEENFQHIADSWTVHLRQILKRDAKISPRQVAEMMVLLKMARTIKSPTEDSYVDAAGYAGIAGELAEREEQIRKLTQIVKTDETTENKSNIVVNMDKPHRTNDGHSCGSWCR